MTEWNFVHERKLPATSFMMRTPCVKLLEDEWPESVTRHDVRQTCLAPAWHIRKLLCAKLFAQVTLCKLQCVQVALRKLLCASCSVCKLLCASCSAQVALGTAQTGRCKLVCASCSTQVALRKLHCANCSAQVAPRKLLRASWSLQVAPCKLLCANCSAQVAPCKLLCASCSVQVALCKLLCVSYSAQVALGKAPCANWSVQVGLRKLVCASCSVQLALRKLLCASCFMQVASCDARPRTRNRTRDPPVPGAGARTTRQLPRTSLNNKSRKKPRAPQKSQNTSSFCTSTTPIPAEGRASAAETVKNSRFAPRPRRGSRKHRRNRKKNLEFLHLDHADPRRGSREPKQNRKKPRVFAPRPRRSPQRVDYRVASSALPRRPKKRF